MIVFAGKIKDFRGFILALVAVYGSDCKVSDIKLKNSRRVAI